MTHHILVVDDDPSIRETVSEVLHLEGYAVDSAVNGADALAAIERHPPKLVLLDMRMPVMDGWGFARRLVEGGIELPIIVMTAAQNARAWCDEIGAADCLAKPFDLDDLLTRVGNFFPAI